MSPWELDPQLRANRLVLLAKVAIDTRREVFAHADREAGDTNWGLGCKAHERFLHALTRLAAGGAHAWLEVRREGLAFVPCVGGTPIRVYRGFAERPPARHVQGARVAWGRTSSARQITLPLPGVDEGPPWLWMMAVETDPEGDPTRVVYFQATPAGRTRNAWAAPVGAARLRLVEAG